MSPFTNDVALSPRATQFGIPRQIIQFGEPPGTPLPPVVETSMASVRAFAAAYDYEYLLLTIPDVVPLLTAIAREVPTAAALIRECQNFGQLSDLLRFSWMHINGGWWFDWDLEVVHETAFAQWMETNADYEWTCIIDDSNDYVCTEVLGATPGNSISRPFLEWVTSRNISEDTLSWYMRANDLEFEHDFPLGPEFFTRFLRQKQTVRRGYRLVPQSHTYQASFDQIINNRSFESTPDDPRPIAHHWVHGWKRQVDFSAWKNSVLRTIDQGRHTT